MAKAPAKKAAKATKAPAKSGAANLRDFPRRVPISECAFVKSMSPQAITAVQAERWGDFIENLADGYSVKKSANDAGLSEVTVYARRKDDEEFAAVWEEARAIGYMRLEDEAKRRALKGTLEPVFYQGAECGKVRKFSDQLLMFLLTANVDKYKKKQELTHKGGINITIDETDARA